jgi:hypothetical protein
MKRPTKRDFLIGDDQFAKHYDRVGQITAMNKYIDYLEQQVKKCDLADVGGSLLEGIDADYFENIECEIDGEIKDMHEYRILVEPDSNEYKQMRKLFG